MEKWLVESHTKKRGFVILKLKLINKKMGRYFYFYGSECVW